MFTAGNVDHYIGRHSIDIVVDSRSRVCRLLIAWRSRGGRLLIDRVINHRPSIGRYFIDTPRPNMGHMLVVNWSTVGDVLVNCRSHISRVLI